MQIKHTLKPFDHCSIQFSIIYFLLGICLFQIIPKLDIRLIYIIFISIFLYLLIIILMLFYDSKHFGIKKIIYNLSLPIKYTTLAIYILSLFLGVIWINLHVNNFKKNNHFVTLLEGKSIIIQATVLNISYIPKYNNNNLNTKITIPNNITNNTRNMQLDLHVNQIIDVTKSCNLIYATNIKHENHKDNNLNIKKLNEYLINSKIRVTWSTDIAIQPGNIWQFNVILKKPRNFATPGNIDLEKQLFTQRIKLIGTVYNKDPIHNKLISNKPQFNNYLCLLNKIRRKIFEQLSTKMQNLNIKYSGIILGFLLGNKENILFNEKLIFQATGTSHLLCISGLHLGMLASFVFIISKWLLQKLSNRYILENFPSIIIASTFCILITNFYGILAGLTPPTLRALIMLNGYFIGIITRNLITIDWLYFVSILLILMLDPFVTLSNSFWLSYIAVGILIFTSKNEITLPFINEKIKKTFFLKNLLNLLKNNWIIFVGLLPINILIFNKIYLIAYIANFIAIPWFNFLILPFSMLGLLINYFNSNIAEYLFIFTNFNLNILLNILTKLSKFKYAYLSVGTITTPIFYVSLTGSVLFILPKGLRNIYIATICCLPIFFTYKENPQYADIWFSILDVGQGLAIVMKLQKHIILYDTGPNNSVVKNYLVSSNLYNLDEIIISHPDLDHIGGLKKLVDSNEFKINNHFITNTNNHKVGYLKSTFCQADVTWELDGVKFKFLSPEIHQDLIFNNSDKINTNNTNNKKSFNKNTKNDNSCILQISGNGYKALLTGDISSKTEKLLINKYQQELTADILIVPHHGSISSSSEGFLKTVNPQYAIISAGYMNRYKHPDPKILNRYKKYNIKILNTIEHGSIEFKLFNQNNPYNNSYFKETKKNNIQYSCYRKINWNFWNY